MTFVSAALASIPSPSWNSISIGPLDLRLYGLMIALGVIAAVWLMGKQLEAHGLGTTDDAGSMAVWGVVAGVIGARLYHVVTDWSRFSDDLGSIPKIWEGGLGIPGGLVAGVLAGAYQARRRGVRPAVAMTFAAPALALAQAIGRWGNWFNQELFGRPTDLPWALEIDDEHIPAGFASGTTFHPTFLYESLWNVALCLVLLRVQRRFRLGAGRLLAVYAIGYGAGRFWIEGLRIDPTSEVGGLRWNQWVALTAVVVGVVALVLTRGRRWDDEAERAWSDQHRPEQPRYERSPVASNDRAGGGDDLALVAAAAATTSHDDDTDDADDADDADDRDTGDADDGSSDDGSSADGSSGDGGGSGGDGGGGGD